jgi:regulatory factor X 1/2/3
VVQYLLNEFTALFMLSPGSLSQAISNFAKGLESWLTAAMTGCPEEMVHIKVSAVRTLARSLRRHITLNRLANAARGMLQNSAYTSQMLVDLNQIDFHNIQEQVCMNTIKIELL